MGFIGFLKTIDLFGRTVNIRFMGREKFKTRCGGLSTLIMLLTLIFIFSLGIYDVWRGEVDSFNSMILNIHEMDESLTAPELAKAMREKRVLAFAIDNPVIDDSFLKITAQHEVGKSLMSMSHQLYNCSDFVYNNLITGLKAVVPENLHIRCLNVSAYDLNQAVNPSITMSICRRKGAGIDQNTGVYGSGRCKPWKDVQSVLRRVDVWAFALTDSTNYASTDRTQKKRFTASRIPISYRYQKMARLTLRKMKIESLEGALIQSKKTKSTVAFLSDEQEITSSYREGEILHLSLRMDRNSQVLIKKRYKSIFRLFAYIGGLYKGIAIFFGILVFPVREVLYYKNLINNMFNVCLDQKQKEIALKTMFPEEETAKIIDDNEDDDPGGKTNPGIKFDRNRAKKRKEMARRKTDNGFYKKLMLKKLTDKESMQGGLFDDVIGKMTQDQIFNNMVRAINDLSPEERRRGGNKFSDLLVKGLKLKSRNKRKRRKLTVQPPGLLPDGKMRDLNAEEKGILMSDDLLVNLRKWRLRAKGSVLDQKMRSFVQDRKELINFGSREDCKNLGKGNILENQDGASRGCGRDLFKKNVSFRLENSPRQDISQVTDEHKNTLKNVRIEDEEKDNDTFNQDRQIPMFLSEKISKTFNNHQNAAVSKFAEPYNFNCIGDTHLLNRAPQSFKDRIKAKNKVFLDKGNFIERLKKQKKSKERRQKSLKKDPKDFNNSPKSSRKGVEQSEKGKILEVQTTDRRHLLERMGDSEAGGGEGEDSKDDQNIFKQIFNQNKKIEERPQSDKKSKKINKKALANPFVNLKNHQKSANTLDSFTNLNKGHPLTTTKNTKISTQNSKKSTVHQTNKAKTNSEDPQSEDTDDTHIQIQKMNSGLSSVLKGIKFLTNRFIGRKSGFFSKSKTKNAVAMMEKKMKENNKKLEDLKRKNQMLYNSEAMLNFSAGLADYVLFWLPNWLSGVYPKKELFYQGREMIRSKLEVGSIITGMNELEKLKSLLFDENQYYLFQNIQKPFLIGFDIIEEPEEDKEAEECSISQEKELKFETGEAEIKIGKETKTAKFKKKTSSYTINYKRKKQRRTRSLLKEKKSKFSVLLSNQSFWSKDDDVQQNVKNFERALDCVKKKGSDQNVIDKRLLIYFNGVFGY